MLDLQIAIISRITDFVPGLTTIANPSVLAGVREIGPLLPACIVIPGGGEPGEQHIPSLPLIETQEWDVVVIIAHQSRDSEDGLTEQIAGDFMRDILKALHGWKNGAQPQKHGFIYTGRSQPNYNLGYAEFPMTFTAKAIVGS